MSGVSQCDEAMIRSEDRDIMNNNIHDVYAWDRGTEGARIETGTWWEMGERCPFPADTALWGAS